MSSTTQTKTESTGTKTESSGTKTESSGSSSTQQKASSSSTSSSSKSKLTSDNSAWKEYGSKKAELTLPESEIFRVIDLGLGRGVDGTGEKPWTNKTSFQVRRVTYENVIGTEEGGALQSYEREITSIQTQQTNLKATIVVPQAPVEIGIDAEHSRTHSTSRRAIGKKVRTRSISFRSGFEDVPQSRASNSVDALTALPTITYKKTKLESDAAVGDPQSLMTFEERLSKWILEQIIHRQKSEKGSSELHFIAGENPIENLVIYLQHCTEDEKKRIITYCHDFVKHFRITHYISEIELGASEYRVLSETEYFNRIGAGGSFGLEALANVAVSHSASWKKTKKASDLKRIGIMSSDGVVTRGSYGEAVVGVKMQPITNLVRLGYTRKALQTALVSYVEQRGDTSSGPFLITCNNDSLFLTVNPQRGYAVEATEDIRNASVFFIFPHDDGNHPYEFIIGYYGDKRKIIRRQKSTIVSASNEPAVPIPRFLSAHVDIFGLNSGPLYLKFNVSETDSRLTLHSRLVKRYAPVDTKAWVSGQEIFYISCARRRLKRDGFVCVRQNTQRRVQAEWITGCLPSINRHNEYNVFMLFRLLPGNFRDKPGLLNPKGDATGDVESSDKPTFLKLETPEGRRKVPRHSGAFDDTSKLLSEGATQLDTSGGTIPPTGAGIDMAELGEMFDPTSIPVRKDTTL